MSASVSRRHAAVLAALLCSALLVFALATSVAAATLQPAFDQGLIANDAALRTWGMALADFNGDGFKDIAAANTFGDVKIYRGTGTGFLPALSPVGINAPYHNAYGLAAGDFNGDTKQDIILSATADATGGIVDGGIYLYLGNGNGTFQSGAAGGVGLALGDAGTDTMVPCDAPTSTTTETWTS